MKKGFLLSKPASKTASTSSTTQVTHTSASKSPLSNRFHDVIVDFISGLIRRNPSKIFSTILTTDPSALEEFLDNCKDQKVPLEKLSSIVYLGDVFPIIAQFFATFLNLFLLDDKNQAIFLMDSELRQEWEAYTNKQSPDMEDLRDPMHQSDMSINVDVLDTNSIGSFDDEILATPHLQLQTPSKLDEQVVSTFSTESSEYTPSKPSGSRTVTFNQSTLSPPSTPYKQQLKRNSKPQSMPINNGKKLKQKETDNTLRNGNVIITRYVPQDQEQAQMLDLVVYDILAKWDNYTLLANLG
ncbi:hypothetical protein RclHR1_25160002 [Rhizophagus clarus]|uniref:Uncharacterized protein n=1 Tax=Rhizophagus clarus TaxID=94130 RepID=A0A2Z6QZA1_9GLOM|nr:hypothetical protein RclHR1_25160002 [Rhizophagus clarus]